MHMDWTRTVAGRLKSDYRYSAKLVYNNFPWPTADEKQQETIEKLAQKILDAREAEFTKDHKPASPTFTTQTLCLQPCAKLTEI